MDRTFPPQNCSPPSADRSAGTAGRRGYIDNWQANWATVSSFSTASRVTLALNDALWFLRPCDTSRPSFTPTLTLGAGFSLSYLSEFRGPPQNWQLDKSQRDLMNSVTNRNGLT